MALENIRRNIRHLREEKELSQRALSRLCNYDETYIGKVERGTKRPSLETLIRLSRELETPLDQFFIAVSDNEREKDPEFFNNLPDQLFRDIFERAYNYFVILDPDGKILTANKSFLKAIGEEIKSISGLKLWEMPCWEDAVTIQQDINQILQSRPDEPYVREQVKLSGLLDKTTQSVRKIVSPRYTDKTELMYLVIEMVPLNSAGK